LGAWSEARRIAEERHAFWAVIVEPEETAHIQLGMTSAIEKHLGNVPLVFVVSKMTGIPDRWNRHQMDEGLPGLLVEQHLLLPIPQLVKRGMDLAVATLAGLVLLPLFAVLAIATKLTSRGSVFYGHRRVGRGNTRFNAWKFRTMVADADKLLEEHLAAHPELRAEWDRDHKLKDDPRVTALGKWMRKWSIDELPQVWNVIRGEMSVVGPRPIVDAEIVKYGEHFEVFNSVLPGITGLWQVCGRNDTTYEERIQLDMYYVHHWSPWLDLYLLVRTVKTVLFTRGAY
jgi:Undecaprenyl-phosphate galactose phosphotransferase WbaP